MKPESSRKWHLGAQRPVPGLVPERDFSQPLLALYSPLLPLNVSSLSPLPSHLHTHNQTPSSAPRAAATPAVTQGCGRGSHPAL